ncbi:PREDICTED: LOC109947472 [Prunus dulcis]|uniref:PREDICTED: LOC109947472 n=1 Tax=Prunus dulcis TaxID=3755 RepID=A0A5E4G016_PRUDU|nr:PREDICTED: LOC109947472 [Prunus dulcis]
MTDSSWIDHSSVAIVESNEVTRNNTNVADVGGDVGTYFMDIIDFSKVKKMHGGHNDIKINEVLVLALVDIDLKDCVEFEGFSTDLVLEVVNDEFFVCWMEYEAWSQNAFDIVAGGLGAKTETGGGRGALRDRVVVVTEN